MTKVNQTQFKDHSNFIFRLAQDAADANSLAYEVVSELSAIFEAIEQLALSGHNDEKVTNKLASVGFSHSLHRLDLIERNMKYAKKILADVEEADCE